MGSRRHEQGAGPPAAAVLAWAGPADGAVKGRHRLVSGVSVDPRTGSPSRRGGGRGPAPRNVALAAMLVCGSTLIAAESVGGGAGPGSPLERRDPPAPAAPSQGASVFEDPRAAPTPPAEPLRAGPSATRAAANPRAVLASATATTPARDSAAGLATARTERSTENPRAEPEPERASPQQRDADPTSPAHGDTEPAQPDPAGPEAPPGQVNPPERGEPADTSDESGALGAVTETVGEVAEPVAEVTEPLTSTVGSVTEPVTGTVGNLLAPLG